MCCSVCVVSYQHISINNRSTIVIIIITNNVINIDASTNQQLRINVSLYRNAFSVAIVVVVAVIAPVNAKRNLYAFYTTPDYFK